MMLRSQPAPSDRKLLPRAQRTTCVSAKLNLALYPLKTLSRPSEEPAESHPHRESHPETVHTRDSDVRFFKALV